MIVRMADFKLAQIMHSVGVHLLRDAWEYARECNEGDWQMSVEIASLRAAGLTNSELRWLISRGLVNHQVEVTRASDRTRRFRKINSLVLPDGSCFVLTPAGRELIYRLGSAPNEVAPGEIAERAAERRSDDRRAAPPSPHWDAMLHELTIGSTLVKRFRCPAKAQERILLAFQEDGWPPAIDDPLPTQFDQDPKRRLHYTIRNLNRGQRPLRIRFFINGNGETIRWEVVPQRTAKRAGSARPARSRR
jgi:hypothetical protein